MSKSPVETKCSFDPRHGGFLNSVLSPGQFSLLSFPTFNHSSFELLLQSGLQEISVVLPASPASLPPLDVLRTVLGLRLTSLLSFSPPEVSGRQDDLLAVVGSFYGAGYPGLG